MRGHDKAGGTVTTDRGRPTYKLEELWTALEAGEFRFHRPAWEGVRALGWTETDACDCLHSLSKRTFVKSMIGREFEGWHDVYKAELKGRRVYIHFCRLTADDPFIIAAFKADADFDC